MKSKKAFRVLLKLLHRSLLKASIHSSRFIVLRRLKTNFLYSSSNIATLYVEQFRTLF